ncbi:hypothetical protein [Corallococcus aberystwythensis]|uniref:Uncharacterized protein n=1 Tax=Corallococcus aberystwythensis TaxID=2316722 RepID=A0A3A8Q979_9BACT|nr:hypothetical protein [Corallococcus aberystwythensis]RKH64111.1 hypothetical protein D7W81_19120 [Corallococcus aberystwythensis]
MSPPRGYDPKPPPGKPAGGKRAPKFSGPATTLTYKIQTAIVAELRQGATKRMAAALAGTTDARLQNWLRRGREAIEAGKRSRYTEFVVEVERAQAEFQKSRVKDALDSISDKTMDGRGARWFLAVTAPKDFTIPREPAAPAGNGHGPLFEVITPDEARAKLDEKLATFIAKHLKARVATDVPPEPAPEDDDGG